MLIMRPKEITPLDRIVPRFTLGSASLVKATEAVRRIFEASYILRAYPAVASPSGESEISKLRREQYNERFSPMITLDLSNVTVEEILTAIALQTGSGACWSVRYTSTDRRFEDSVVSFSVPRGTLQMSAGPQRR
jgi:hypothetical protein